MFYLFNDKLQIIITTSYEKKFFKLLVTYYKILYIQNLLKYKRRVHCMYNELLLI